MKVNLIIILMLLFMEISYKLRLQIVIEEAFMILIFCIV